MSVERQQKLWSLHYRTEVARLPFPFFSCFSQSLLLSLFQWSARRSREWKPRRKLLLFESRRGKKEKKRRGKRKERQWGEKDEEGERNTSGHEGERQIKFDHKLHEIVGEPRWSASVLWPMPTRLFLATDYHDRPAPEDTTSEGLARIGLRADPTTSHVPDTDNAPNVRNVTQRWIRWCAPCSVHSRERLNGRHELYPQKPFL